MNIHNAVETKNVIVRIRPQKVVILVNNNIGHKELLLAVDFLSRIWGGKYCSILVVNSSGNIKYVQRNLISIRPDIVLCFGLDFSKWSKIIENNCQPRGTGILNGDYVKQLSSINRHKLIPATLTILDAVENSPQIERDNLYFFSGNNSNLPVFMSLGFGFLSDEDTKNYADVLKAKVIEPPENITSYLKTCTDMSTKWCWLDFARSHLSTNNLFGQFPMPPTVIVCKEKIADYALYWNLRSQLSIGSSGTIALFPETEIDDTESVESLSEWIISSPVNSNYCMLRSSSVAKKKLDHLARRLRPRLKSSRIEYIDTKTETKSELAPIVIPYEKQTHIKVSFSENQLNFDCIKPGILKHTNSSNSWICDFVEDSETKRALCELVLPPRSSAIQVLNAPCPPKIGLSHDKVRWGPDSLNVKCSSNDPIASFGIPTDEELIVEILREAGIKTLKDEKRIRYNQVINMLGGLKETFLAFSGSSRKVIKAFGPYNSNSLNQPLTLGEIKSKARLKSSGTTASRPVYDMLRKHLPPHTQNIAQRRFNKYFEYDISHGRNEQKIADRLVQRGILKRKWKLDKCRLCDKEYWVELIDINKPMHCPGCGNVIILNGQITLGYELNELVRLAITEGIIPVILTANFLYNTTSKGFIWLPGVKCQSGNINTDLDLVCICDGHLFAAECKTLNEVSNNSKIWANLAKQLANPFNLVKKAGFEGFILSSLSENYPQTFQNKLNSISKGNIKVSFLNKTDLISGRRMIKRRDHEWPIIVEDLLIQNIIPRKKKRKGKRTISF